MGPEPLLPLLCPCRLRLALALLLLEGDDTTPLPAVRRFSEAEWWWPPPPLWGDRCPLWPAGLRAPPLPPAALLCCGERSLADRSMSPCDPTGMCVTLGLCGLVGAEGCSSCRLALEALSTEREGPVPVPPLPPLTWCAPAERAGVVGPLLLLPPVWRPAALLLLLLVMPMASCMRARERVR